VVARGDLSALDEKITFNVLDHVEYEPQSGKLILMGHRDAGYATSGIRYLQYLATLLEYPSPQFSLEWTRDSEARVAELRRRLNSDDEWRRLAGEWGRWIDQSEHVTPAGRYFMPLFGIEVPVAGQKMDKYQVLSGVFRAIGEQQAAEILAAFGGFHRAMPNPGIPQLYRLFRAAGVYELFVKERSELQAGRMTEYQVQVDVYRAMFKSFDQALNYSGQPTLSAFNNMVGRGQTPDAAMEAAMSEFDRQFEGAYGQALRRLYRSKAEFQIPVTLVNPSLRDTLNVEPKFIGVNASTLLAKLLLDADVAAKKLLNAPELADKIPGYQTEVTYRLSRPGSRHSGHVSMARLWISPEQIDALRSSDGNILVLRETKMRINIHEQSQDGRDIPNQGPGEYETLLTSLYDGFARNYSPIFHELREAAKLTYVAQWLKARNASFKLPSTGLATWRAPASVPGVIFISWSADPSRPDVQTVSAIGGVILRVPPAGPGICVKFCDDKIPTDRRIRSISALPAGTVIDLGENVTQTARTWSNIIGLYVSNLHNPFEAYASAEAQQGPTRKPSASVIEALAEAAKDETVRDHKDDKGETVYACNLFASKVGTILGVPLLSKFWLQRGCVTRPVADQFHDLLKAAVCAAGGEWRRVTDGREAWRLARQESKLVIGVGHTVPDSYTDKDCPKGHRHTERGHIAIVDPRGTPQTHDGGPACSLDKNGDDCRFNDLPVRSSHSYGESGRAGEEFNRCFWGNWIWAVWEPNQPNTPNCQ
jgi:hypothetical protein